MYKIKHDPFHEVKTHLIQRHHEWLEKNDTHDLYQMFYQASRLERLLNLTRDIRGRVLDVGCFDGYVAKKILDQGHKEVFGMDRLEKALERAAARGIKTKLGDIDDAVIDFPDNYFDGIIMGEVLDYVFDPDAVIAEVRRTLKPRGKLIITVPNLVGLNNRVRVLFGRPPYSLDVRPRQGGYWRYFTFRTLERLLIDQKFKIVVTESNAVAYPLFTIPGIRKLFPGDQLERRRIFYSVLLARIFPTLGENIIVLAEKDQ